MRVVWAKLFGYWPRDWYRSTSVQVFHNRWCWFTVDSKIFEVVNRQTNIAALFVDKFLRRDVQHLAGAQESRTVISNDGSDIEPCSV